MLLIIIIVQGTTTAATAEQGNIILTSKLSCPFSTSNGFDAGFVLEMTATGLKPPVNADIHSFMEG